MNLTAGQRQPLSALNLREQFSVTVTTTLPGTDISAFGLQNGKLSDDRYMVFYNQPSSPDGAVRANGTRFAFDLSRLALHITEVLLTATHDDLPVARGQLRVVLGDAVFDAGAALKEEKAAMLLRFYRYKDGWRVEAVGQGFNGGLAALVKHFGGEVQRDVPAAPAVVSPTASPAPHPAPVSLKKERQRVLLDKAQRQAPELVSLIKAAQVSLEKRGLDEAVFQVKLVLDISASMNGQYRSGSVQDLANRALALAARLDDDGEVEVYLFGMRPHRAGTLSISNARNFVSQMRVRLEGGTHYAPVMDMVRADVRAASTKLPSLVLFITDGASQDARRVEKLMREASSEPIFWKFMGIEQGRVNFDFLERLDDLSGRRVDNANFFKVKAPIHMPDEQLFECLVHELDSWQRAARKVGIIR